MKEFFSNIFNWFENLFVSNGEVYWAVSPAYDQINANGIYKMQVFLGGFRKNKFVIRDVMQLCIDINEVLPANTWALVVREGDSYFMQIPVYIGNPGVKNSVI